MATSHLAQTAFPLEDIHSLPTIQELVKNVQTCKKPSKQDNDAGVDPATSTTTATEETDDDFILVEASPDIDVMDTSPATPVAEVAEMSIDELPRKSPFIDMIVRDAQETSALARTENNAVTYSTSLQPLVDLFYAVKDKSQAYLIRQHLEAAWNIDALKALKLVFFLRDVRDGKGCSEEFYTAAQWLLKSHPETFKYNVVQFCPRFGYWKDLLQLLVREYLGEEGLAKERSEAEANRRIFDPDNRAKRLEAVKSQHAVRRSKRSRRGVRLSLSPDPVVKTSALKEKKARSKARRAEYEKMTPEEAAKAKAEFAMQVEEKQAERHAAEKAVRSEKRDESILECRTTWTASKEYRDLHMAVAKQFAVALHLDKLRLGAKKNVSSLCAKWAPTPDHYHDKHTRVATTIALILFPAAIHQVKNESDEQYVVRALKMYQREYLTPLREAAKVTEALMSAQKWDSIEYSHVPAISFKRNQGGFKNHDPERFVQHVLDAASGKDGKKIQASTLKPNDIVGQFLGYRGRVAGLEAQVTEAQWLNYVESIKKSGSLDNCIAIADVSGSMHGTPLECSIALSLLVATVAKPPFNRTFITFSTRPQFVVLSKSATTLRQQVDEIQRLHWEMNTNFQAVFDLLLKKAKENRLAKEDMIKTIFVFSDMQFDQAASPALETDYQQIKRKFTNEGYDVPKIVFWNLRGKIASATPVLFDTIGTAMVSGWSGQLLKLFMENGGDMINSPAFSPEFVMHKAIGKPGYDVLKVID